MSLLKNRLALNMAINQTTKEYSSHVDNYYIDSSYYDQFLLTDLPNGSTVLDVGCGNGLFLKKLSLLNKNLQLFGVEANQFLIDKARQNTPLAHMDLVDLNQGQLPFANDTFDSIFCLDVIEHLVNPLDLLKEIKRVLKPSGHLILCTPDRFAFLADQRFGKNFGELLIFNLKKLLGKTFVDPGHIHEFDIFELKKILRQGGLLFVDHYQSPWRFRVKLFLRLIPFIRHSSFIFVLKKVQ